MIETHTKKTKPSTAVDHYHLLVNILRYASAIPFVCTRMISSSMQPAGFAYVACVARIIQ